MHRTPETSPGSRLRPRLLAGALALLALGACAPAEDEPSLLVAASVALPAPGGAFESGLYLPINDLLMVDRDDVQVVANGNLALSWVDSTFEGTVDDDDQLDSFDGSFGLRGAATLELAIDGGGDISGALDLATIPLPPFGVGPSIEVSPFVQVKVLVTGSADSGARLSIVAPFRVGTAFSGAGVPEGGVSTVPEFKPEVGLPDLAEALNFQGTIKLEVTLAFMIDIEGIPVGGPAIGTHVGAALIIDGGNGTWDLDSIGEIVGSWVFRDPLTLFPNIPDHLPLLRRLPKRNIAGGPIPEVERSTRWSRVFDISNDDEAAAAIPDGDGLIVVERGGNPWLATLDGLGVPVPGRQGTSVTPLITKAMVRAENGDLLVTGASGTSIRLDRYDSSGGPLWTRTLSVPGASRTTAEALVATPSNGAILAGAVTRSSVNTPIVASIREDGSVEWATEVDMGAGSTSPDIDALALTPSGDILAVGAVTSMDTASYYDSTIALGNALVLRLDADGNLLSARAVGARGYESARTVAMFEDGSYAIGGDDGFAPYGVWIASFRPDDSLRWSASYLSRPESAGSDDATPYGLAPLPGNGLLVAGYTGATAGKDAWIMRLDDEGMPRWLKSYVGDKLDELSGVFAMPDGLAAYGRTGTTEDSSTYEDLWVIRTAVDGMIHFDPDSGLDAENTEVQWLRSRSHTVQVLAPVPLPTTLDGAPATSFTVIPAAAVGELLTD